MAITSTFFTDSDVFGEMEVNRAAAFMASLMCKNALDELSSKFGKPEVLWWVTSHDDLITNPYSRKMWEAHRTIFELEDTWFEREKFAATVCPFMKGSMVALKFEDPQAVYDYAITQQSVLIDSFTLWENGSITIFTKLGIGRGYSNLLNPQTPVYEDSTVDGTVTFSSDNTVVEYEENTVDVDTLNETLAG